MSLEKLEHYLDKTEAVTQYPQVKEEYEELKRQHEKVMDELSKYKALAVHVDGVETTLEVLLQKVEEHTRRTRRREIARKAQAMFEAERSQLVQKELKRTLQLPNDKMPKGLRSLLDQKTNDTTNQILRTPSQWPPWFQHLQQQHIQQGIHAGLNATFWQHVDAGVAQAKRNAWPTHLATHIREVVTPFCQRGILSQLPVPTPLRKTCDKCGTANAWDFYPEHIAQLVSVPELRLSCQNPHCRGLILKHRIGVTLGDLIMGMVGPPSYPSE